MVYMYHSFLIHSSADGHLGCFHVLAMINSAAKNIGVHVSLSDWVSSDTLWFWLSTNGGQTWVCPQTELLIFCQSCNTQETLSSGCGVWGNSFAQEEEGNWAVMSCCQQHPSTWVSGCVCGDTGWVLATEQSFAEHPRWILRREDSAI